MNYFLQFLSDSASQIVISILAVIGIVTPTVAEDPIVPLQAPDVAIETSLTQPEHTTTETKDMYIRELPQATTHDTKPTATSAATKLPETTKKSGSTSTPVKISTPLEKPSEPNLAVSPYPKPPARPQKVAITDPDATIYSSTINVQTYTYPTPTITGSAILDSTQKVSSVDLVISKDGTIVFEEKGIPVEKNIWYSIVTTPLKPGMHTVDLYQASGRKLLSSNYFTVNPGPVGINTLTADGKALFEMFLGGSMSKSTVNREDALSNCKINATNNPNRIVNCYWNGEKIFTQAGKDATIDAWTLTTLSNTPTFTGTAVGLNQIEARLSSNNVTCGGCLIYGSTSTPLYIPVTNGKWSLEVSSPPLPKGQYRLILLTDRETNLGLASGYIVVMQ